MTRRSTCRLAWRSWLLAATALAVGAALLPAAGLEDRSTAAGGKAPEPTAGHKVLAWATGAAASSCAGAGRSMTATAGQPDAGTVASAGYVVGGGFWSARNPDVLFADDLENGDTVGWSRVSP